MRFGTSTSTLLLLAIALAVPAAGQSMQRLSIQGSGAMVFPTSESSAFENDTRLGWEAQLRYTFSRFSLGAGYQRSVVYQLSNADFSAAVPVLFLEPRYVVTAGSTVALYLAGRAGIGTLQCKPKPDCPDQSAEPALGGGGGLLFAVGSRISIDLGSQYFSTRYTPASGATKIWAGFLLARAGLSIGL